MDFSRLFERWQNAQSIGIDFGASHFKWVQLLRDGEAIRLVACGMVEGEVGEDEEAALRRVRGFLREHGVRPVKSIVSIADETLRIRRMELAKMPERDLKIAIRWNFREHVDVPLEKYLVSYTAIPMKLADDRQALMAYGISADAIARCQARFRKLGIPLRGVEPAVSALLAAVDHSLGWTEGERIALVDLGFHESLFSVMGDGILFFSRPLSGVSGERLLRVLERDGAVPAEQARELFKTICTADAAPEPPVAAVMEEFYTQLLLEMQRSIDGFIALYPGGEVKRIYVCGGGSALPNLASHLSKNLGIATDLFNPFQRIVDPEGKAPAVPALYAVAVGLAMPPRRKGKG